MSADSENLQPLANSNSKENLDPQAWQADPNHTPTIVGICAKDGLLLATQNNSINLLMDLPQMPQMIQQINKQIICATTGPHAQSLLLMEKLRIYAHQYELIVGKPMACRKLVDRVSQALKSTVSGHLIKTIVGCWCETEGFRLFAVPLQPDSEGQRFLSYGRHSSKITEFLEEFFDSHNEEQPINVSQAEKAILKALALQETPLHPETLQFAKLKREDGKLLMKILPRAENLEILIKAGIKVEAKINVFAKD